MTTTTITTKKINLGGAKQLEELLNKALNVKNTYFAIEVISLMEILRLKTTNLLETKLKEFDEINKDKKSELDKYETKRIEILEKYALKDANGEFLLIKLQNGSQMYDFKKEDIEPRDKELTILAEEYKDLLSSISKVDKEISNAEFDLDITNIKQFFDEKLNKITDLSANEIILITDLKRILL